ncbi:MAG TPA: hypothetical protein VIA80_06740 [Hyphomonadaceae bacterium]|jgi:hypothetical protein
MAENLISKLIPHQGCVITRKDGFIEIAGSSMNWVMSAAIAPFVCRAPFVFRVVGRTDSTNLRMHWHRGELIFNWECNVRELRVHDPATAEQHSLKDKGFLSTNEWHEILWEIGLKRMRVIVDGDVRYDGEGDYSGFESAPSVGPCFGSTVSIREFSVSSL